MKKIFLTITALAFTIPLFAGVVKESQAKREVDDAIQALAQMDARTELSTYLPQREAYAARTYCNKAQNNLKDSDYDKASYYAILSTNYSKISVAKGLLAKAEKDRLEAAVAAQKADTSTVAPRLKGAGLKRKGSSPMFAGTFDLSALYDIKRAPKVDAVPALTADMASRITDMSGVLNEQKEIKIQLSAKGKSEELAAKYAANIKDAMIEKGVEAARITVEAKKGKDGVEITLDNVKAK